MSSTDDRAPAVAYLRTDISGTARAWHEQQILRLAIRYGYEVRKTVTSDTDCLIALLESIRAHSAEAVFIPSHEHLGERLAEVVAAADVIYASGETVARWSPIATALLNDPPAAPRFDA